MLSNQQRSFCFLLYKSPQITDNNNTILFLKEIDLYMKATGIVRRIDDLGRVVIPKEIRRTMRIREGDPLEIYTGIGGEVVFKKYSPIGELSEFAGQYAEAIAKNTKFPVVICDRDHCVAAAGISKKEVLERRITASLEDAMEQRRTVNFEGNKGFEALEGIKREVKVGVPIINAGDVSGADVLMADETGAEADDSDIKLVTVAADFLGRQME